MAKYNLIFTVRDKYGKEKDLDSVEVDFELGSIDLDSYATDLELAEAIKDFKEDMPTVIEENSEVHPVITEVVEKHIDTIKYSSFDAPADSEGNK